MKWHIPAKTFLVGEYAALAGESALVLTSSPDFTVELTTNEYLEGINPLSPAGVFWSEQRHPRHGLKWHDPYRGIGGLGASSAQFIGAYYASCYLNRVNPGRNKLLDAYYQTSWSGKGIKPSGYDVIAQVNGGITYIRKTSGETIRYDWPFQDLSLHLLHTGEKLATHHHLEQAVLPSMISELADIANESHSALQNKNRDQFIHAINSYHEALKQEHLIAAHTLAHIKAIKENNTNILAIKGCGALGADIILVITPKDATLNTKCEKIKIIS